MPKVLAQATVFQEFNDSIPADVSASLRPHIAGGHAELHRYAVASEKAAASLGAYVPGADTTYNWPGKSTDGVVDLDTVQLKIDDALLRYFQDGIGSGLTIAPVASSLNQVRLPSGQSWKANGSGYPRMAALKDRDVEVGDVVDVTDGTTTLRTYVAALAGDAVPAAVGAPSADAANKPAQPASSIGTAPTVAATGGGTTGGALAAGTYVVRYSFAGSFGETWASAASSGFTVSAGNIPRVTIPALPTGATEARIYLSTAGGGSSTCTLYRAGVTGTTTDLDVAATGTGAAAPEAISLIAGTVNNVTTGTISAGSYTGLAAGDVTETYTITVVTGSTGGDATTARLSVTSASGRDDQTSVTPSAFASATAIGSRGLTVTWTTASANDFLVGQQWRITVRQAWSPPTSASAGTYTGTDAIDYIVQVSRGGLFADATKPQITVTATTGVDASGPTSVTTSGAAIAVGTRGVTIAFTGSGLRKGDFYYVSVSAPAVGAYRTMVLGNNLTTAQQGASDLGVTLYLKKNLTVPVQRVSAPPAVNYVATAASILVKAGIDAYDPTLTNSGVQYAVPVMGGTIYVDYRAWLPTYAEGLYQAASEADVATLFGSASVYESPNNPLAYAVWKAVQNSNGQVVKFSAIADPTDHDLWQTTLDMLEGLNDVYTLVPLTRDEVVWAKYKAHVAARGATGVNGEWRTVWLSPTAETSTVVVNATNSSDTQPVLATMDDDPDIAGTQYTRLSVPAGNGKFVTNGVRAGDIVRYLYTSDAFGSVVYQEFPISSVVNEDTLILATGGISAVSVAQRMEVWRNLTRTQIATALAAYPVATVDKRVFYLWPDAITDDAGNVVPGYFLAAAYAGFIGGIAPHQGLRNVEITGFESTPRSTQFFNNGNLNTLADAGYVVATTDPNTGQVYTKTARSSDPTSVDVFEEAVSRVDDALRYLFYNRVGLSFGKARNTGTALAAVSNDIKSVISHAIADTRIDRIGSLLVDGSIQDLRPHLTVPDKVVLQLNITRSFPLNDADVTFVF